MSRKPARLERAGALTPRDRMWAAIRALSPAGLHQVGFSPSEVKALSGIEHIATVCAYVDALAKAQPPYVVIVDDKRPAFKPRREFFRWAIVRDVGVDTPRVNNDGEVVTIGSIHERLWNAVRHAKGDFDLPGIAATASIPEQAVPVKTAQKFVFHLKRGGYVENSGPAKPARGRLVRFRFLKARNTGERPPVMGRKEILDGNTGTVVWTAAGEGAK